LREATQFALHVASSALYPRTRASCSDGQDWPALVSAPARDRQPVPPDAAIRSPGREPVAKVQLLTGTFWLLSLPITNLLVVHSDKRQIHGDPVIPQLAGPYF